jgi:hypothetical protein
LGNVFVVAVLGVFIFVQKLDRLVRFSSTSSYIFQDAAPYSRRARRFNGAALARLPGV